MRKTTLNLILIIAILSTTCIAILKPNLSDFSDSSRIESQPNTSSVSGGGYLMDTEASFNWEEINSTGTLMGISSQSGGVETILFNEGGWNFTFYETEYDKIYVRSHGWMTFTDFNSIGYWQIPYLQDYDYDMVALLMAATNLDPSIGGDIYYEFLTAPNRLIIEYSNISNSASQLVGDFQVIFYMNGVIKFQYKTIYNVFSQNPTIGLDHGDKLNYNAYSGVYTQGGILNSTAIEFTFDEMIYPNFGFAIQENEEYEYILTSLDALKMGELFGINWEQTLGFPDYPVRSEKFKIKTISKSENTTHFRMDYDVWDWVNRFNDYSISKNFSDSFSYKKNPADYTQLHNLTNLIPFFLPNHTELYLSRANLSWDYSIHYDDSRNTYEIHYSPSFHAFYDDKGLLTDLYITDSSSEIIFDIQLLKPSFTNPSTFKVQEDDDHQWLLTYLNITLMESIFGSQWEQRFGLPANPSENSKIKVKVDSTTDNSTHWNANYSLWDWVDRDSDYSVSPIQENSVSYLKDAFNYTIPHNFSTIFPFFLPKPVELYLLNSNLDSTFYSIPPITYSDHPLTLLIHVDLGGYFGYGAAFYSSDGYLMDIKFNLYSMTGLVINMFHLTHFDTGEKPSNVVINRGDTFSYDVIEIPENAPPTHPLGMFKKVNITIDYVSGDDKYLNRTIVIVNYTIMDTMGTWHTTIPLKNVFMIPVDKLMYIYQNSKDYLQTTAFLTEGFPFMAPIDINWTPFTDFFSSEVYANGFKIIMTNQDWIINYTSYGVLESISAYSYGNEYYSVRMNSTNIDLTDLTSPIININDPNSSDLFSSLPPEYDINITEVNLDKKWYTMDDGVNNMTIVANTGVLDASIWNLLSDGPVTITFYANDTSGNIGSSQITVYKDTIAPVIVINLPRNADEFTTNVPIYNISITEANIDTIWYTMDEGVHNLEITEYIGSVDSTSWNALPNGQVTITFYVNDTVGHLSYETIIVTKNTSTPPSIPGFNFYFLLLSIGLVFVGINWRIKKEII